jgi:hypothetical protein
MQLIYITHNNLLDIHALASWVSWPLVIGAGYGAVSLVKDVLRAMRRPARQPQG